MDFIGYADYIVPFGKQPCIFRKLMNCGQEYPSAAMSLQEFAQMGTTLNTNDVIIPDVPFGFAKDARQLVV